jgi:hypothetical protein
MTPLRGFSSPAVLIRRLTAAADALKGRRGVVAARAKIDRIRAAAIAHNSKVFGHRMPRCSEWVEHGRARRAAVLADQVAGYPAACFRVDPLPSRLGLKILTGWSDGWGVMPDSGRIRLVGGWWCRATQDESEDYAKYSKAWHRAHGPARSVFARTLEIRRFDPVSGVVQRRDVDLTDKGWRGQWWLDALIASGIVEAVKVPSRLRSVQLHRAYSVALVRTIGSVEVFERSIAGDVVDFCVLWHGITYHAASQRYALIGLRQKLVAALRVKHKGPIDLALCRVLGFCDAGVRQFCSDFGLDPALSYTADEVIAAVERLGCMGRSGAALYVQELGTLAKVVGRSDLAEVCHAG